MPDLISQFAQYSLEVEGQLSEPVARGLLVALDWCAQQPECKGNLGLPRSEMPQFARGDVEPFARWLRQQGIRSQFTMERVGDMRATQKEINAARVERYVEKFKRTIPTGMEAIPMSRDGYILDGHHRWAAILTLDPNTKIRVLKVQLPIRDLLKKAHEFPGTFSEEIDAPARPPTPGLPPPRRRRRPGLRPTAPIAAYSYDRRRR